MSDTLRVNGNMHSWGSIIVKIRGEKYSGFTAISYSDKRERVKGYGMGRHHAPIGRSRGKYTVDTCKLTGRKSSVRAVIAALRAAAPDGASYGDVEAEINVQVIEGDGQNGEIPVNDVLEQCVVIGVTASHDESADPLTEDIEWDVMRIRRDGGTLWDASGDLP